MSAPFVLKPNPPASEMWRVRSEYTDDDETDRARLLISFEAEDPDGWFHASVKWDGCVDFRQYFNFPRGDSKSHENYIHICDLDGFIERLTALRDLASKKWSGEWPG